MAKWYFSVPTLEGKKLVYTVTANDKISAVKMGIEKAQKTGLTLIPKFNCELKR